MRTLLLLVARLIIWEGHIPLDEYHLVGFPRGNPKGRVLSLEIGALISEGSYGLRRDFVLERKTECLDLWKAFTLERGEIRGLAFTGLNAEPVPFLRREDDNVFYASGRLATFCHAHVQLCTSV